MRNIGLVGLLMTLVEQRTDVGLNRWIRGWGVACVVGLMLGCGGRDGTSDAASTRADLPGVGVPDGGRADETLEVEPDSTGLDSADAADAPAAPLPEYRSAFLAWQEIAKHSEQDWDTWLDMMLEERITTLEIGVPTIENMGTFDVEGWFKSEPYVDKLVLLAAMAHEKAMDVSVVMPQFIVHDDPAFDEYYAKDADGERLGWLCPANPWTREFLNALMLEWTARIQADSVVLDFIRYLDSYCLCDYHQAHSSGSPGDLAWDEWSADQLTEDVAETRYLLHQQDVALEAYVFTFNEKHHVGKWGTASFTFRGQDWSRWAGEGLVDVVKNMDYYDDQQLLDVILEYQEGELAGSPVQWAPAFWFSHSPGGIDSHDELSGIVSTLRTRSTSGYSVFAWEKIVTRPDDFGWAHNALTELNQP